MNTLAEMIAFEDAREGIKTSKKEIEAIGTVLTVIATVNPKKAPSMSYDRFQGYFRGPETVQEAYDYGLRGDDIRHDAAKGFIQIAE